MYREATLRLQAVQRVADASELFFGQKSIETPRPEFGEEAAGVGAGRDQAPSLPWLNIRDRAPTASFAATGVFLSE